MGVTGTLSTDGAPGARMRFMGRTAAGLLALSGIGQIPANWMLDLTPVTGVAIVTLVVGVLFWFVPWERVPDWALHVVPPLFVGLLIWTIVGAGKHSSVYGAFWFLIAAYAAYAFRAHGWIAFHLMLTVLGAALASALAESSGPDASVRAVVGIPTILVLAGLIVLLRERLERGQAELAALASTDPLTGVANYRTLVERIAYEIHRHARSERPLAVIVLDLDGFKAINERHGHLAGDALLRDVAAGLTATVRASDTVARQGGDEFSVVAPETGAHQAMQLAVRIEDALAQVAPQDGAALGASVGWAVFPEDGASTDELLAVADQRARAAKAEHRSRSPRVRTAT